MTSPSSPVAESAAVCPSCGAAAHGRYCANCGAPLAGATCISCSADLSPGAKFCHRCGTPAGGVTPPAVSKTSSLPWIVAALAFLALFAMAAGRGFNARRSNTVDGSQNALPQAGLDDRGTPSADQSTGVRAPDISSLSPQERADRLYNRVMLLATQGKADSVQFFAPMALTAYQMLAPLNADQRYDMGRIGEVVGAIPLAKAQADSILRENPNHLLGLILEARLAMLAGDTTQLHAYERRLITAEKSEASKKREEYLRHQDDITNALQQAKKSLAGKP
ncbi:MAG TPA: zinc ribbon domain-containing protein [Gemmatimonadaceae bacterium]|nr:zinc ribbon domain-containing protein [Gemmatimonadaceae bacterium]